MKAQKIAVVVPYRFVPPKNGGHKAAYGFCAALAKERPLVCLSTFEDKEGQAPFPLIAVFPHRFHKYFSPLAAWRAYRALKQEAASACIAFQPFIALLLFPATALLGIPLQIYAQNIEYQRFRSMGRWFWPLVFAAEWLAFRLAQHIYFISPDDLPLARRAFGLGSAKCSTVPYGTPYRQAPPDVAEARQSVRRRHGYGEAEFLIAFFGPQSYQPNLEAVELIVHHLNPLLQKQALAPYRFIICGGGLPERYQGLRAFPQVEYLGFVDDIEAYIKACDLVINPVNTGGGVKTKLIEAIAWGKTVVSSRTGALGVLPEACGQKLVVVENEDYQGYCDRLLALQAAPDSPTPASFFDTYYWGNAVRSVLERV